MNQPTNPDPAASMQSATPEQMERLLTAVEESGFASGTQIAYIPNHAHGNIFHPDVEFGFVVKDRGATCLCRYWYGRPAEGTKLLLRTKANSESTPTENLFRYLSVEQAIVDGFIIDLSEGCK